MTLIARFRSWLGASTHRSNLERAMDEELRFHVEQYADDLVRRGVAPDEARRRALMEFGGIEVRKEEIREALGLRVFDDLKTDLRYAARQLRASSAFTSVAVLSLALGIGATTAIFSLINTLMLRTLPVREPAQLVEMLSRYPGEPRINGFAWKYYGHYRDNNHAFSDVIGVASPFRFQVARDVIEPETLDGEYVTGNFFPALGVRPAIGRLIDLKDDVRGAPDAAVAVVSWSYWQSRFNLDPAVPGQRIVVEGVPVTIIGVTPRDFFGLQVGTSPAVWMPTAIEPLIQRPSRRADGTVALKLMGRLRPGVSLQQAQAEMSALDQFRLDDLVRTRNAPFLRQFKLELEPAAAGFSALRDQFARPLVILMIVVALLLLIACTNIASLLLARAATRQREMAVRVSLGAGTWRLVRQTLTESMLLASAGGVLGIGLAYFGAHALVRIMLSGRPFIGLPQHLDLNTAPDARVLLFTAGTVMLTGVLFGLAPSWNACRSIPAVSLREVGRIGESRSRQRFGKSLVMAQVALSIVLLSAAAVFIAHLSNLRNLDLGFRRDSVLLVTLDPARSGYERIQLSRLYQELLGQLERIQGVRSATLSGVTPIEGPGASRLATVEGVPQKPEDRRYISLNWVGPRYFETLGTPLLAGRDFRLDENGPYVAIVNAAMARHYFGDGSPLGKHLTFDRIDRSYEIVGVVGNAKYLSLHEAAPQTIYLNAFQDSRGISQQFVLRTTASPSVVAGDVRRAVRDLLKTVRVANVTTMDDQVNASIVPERLIAVLSGFFGSAGALLAAIGLYGLMAHTVALRTNEIGVRMALGATRGDITVMVVAAALRLVSAGLIIGVPLAFWSRRAAASWIENLRIDDGFPIVIAASVLIGVALVAAYVPARRAARVDPADALRHS